MTDLHAYPTLAASRSHSMETMEQARERIRELDFPFDYMCVVALGSYGRFEAHAQASDFEWLLISDDRKVNAQEAVVAQAALTSLFADLFGRDRLSINKTFGPICEFTDLGTSVGGLAETNRMLTYRILTLTEGLPLSPGSGHGRVLRALAGVYAGSHTAGHRLLSLATELARYYRAVRASYKYKVDEEGKPWAVRAIKNRSYRRLAFVSSALHFVVAGPRIDYRARKLFDLDEVAAFMGSMREAPSVRLLEALAGLEVDPEAVGRVLVIYEQIHSALASSETRRTLDGISAPDRFGHPVYEPLRAACAALQSSMAQLILSLPSQPRQQLIEMFLL